MRPSNKKKTKRTIKGLESNLERIRREVKKPQPIAPIQLELASGSIYYVYVFLRTVVKNFELKRAEVAAKDMDISPT